MGWTLRLVDDDAWSNRFFSINKFKIFRDTLILYKLFESIKDIDIICGATALLECLINMTSIGIPLDLVMVAATAEALEASVPAKLLNVNYRYKS